MKIANALSRVANSMNVFGHMSDTDAEEINDFNNSLNQQMLDDEERTW